MKRLQRITLKRDKLIRTLVGKLRSMVLRATVSKIRLTCGKRTCKCKRGKKHGPYHYLSSSVNGRLTTSKIPAGLEAKVREGVRAYKDAWQVLCELCEVNRKLLWQTGVSVRRDGTAGNPLPPGERLNYY